MLKQIAVTGASGHIGNVVCRKLIEQGCQVKAFYHTDTSALQDLDVELIQGSVLVQEDLRRLIEGCEVVINCAGRISIDGDPNGSVYKTNTQGLKNLLDVSIQNGVKKIIHISSVHAVNELPHTAPYDETRPYKTARDYVYDYSKARGEQILLSEAGKMNAPDIIVLRPSAILGPFDFKPSRMGAALIDFYQQKIPFLPAGGYDLVDVRDVAESIWQAIHHGRNGEIYVLSGKYFKFRELAQVIHDVTGKKVPQHVLPYWLLRMLLPFARVYAKVTGNDKSFTEESIDAVKNGHPHMNHAKAKAELKHTNRPLTETLYDFYQWHHEHNVL